MNMNGNAFFRTGRPSVIAGTLLAVGILAVSLIIFQQSQDKKISDKSNLANSSKVNLEKYGIEGVERKLPAESKLITVDAAKATIQSIPGDSPKYRISQK